MSKRKYSPEWALARVQEYLSGQGSVNGIAAANGMDKKTLRVWVAKYREQGKHYLTRFSRNKMSIVF